MYEKLTKVNWIYVCLILLGLRALVDANFPQALIVACLAGFEGFRQWSESRKPVTLNEEVLKKLENMENNVTGLAMRSAKTAAAEVKPVRFF